MYGVQVSGGIDTNRQKQTKPLCFIRSRTFLAGFLVYDISTVSNEIMWYQVQTIGNDFLLLLPKHQRECGRRKGLPACKINRRGSQRTGFFRDLI